jgi:hypothetical protein
MLDFVRPQSVAERDALRISHLQTERKSPGDLLGFGTGAEFE